MEKVIAEEILRQTETGYDLIADKFSQTRKHFWRGLEFIKDYTHENDHVLDFGCGNGRLLDLFAGKKINYWGIDVSEKLIDKAKERHSWEDAVFQKINPVQSTIPFVDNFFNSVYSIAVFHHFPSSEYRQDLAKELYRVTKDRGTVVVTVWHLWQKKYIKNILRNWLYKTRRMSKLDWNDCMISFTDNQGKKFSRFHHAFTKREIKKLFEDVGFKIEKCEIVDGRNILLIGKK